MSLKKELPEGYAVAYGEGRWYPLVMERFYSAEYPNGYPMFETFYSDGFNTLSFRTQHEAIVHCQQDAEINESAARCCWEQMATESDVYPDHCAHYVDVIEQVTGHEPVITHGWHKVFVFTISDYCHSCRSIKPRATAIAPLIEDALAEVAERVYAERCQCERVQDERLQLIA
jgi:hypothetical protein